MRVCLCSVSVVFLFFPVFSAPQNDDNFRLIKSHPLVVGRRHSDGLYGAASSIRTHIRTHTHTHRNNTLNGVTHATDQSQRQRQRRWGGHASQLRMRALTKLRPVPFAVAACSFSAIRTHGDCLFPAISMSSAHALSVRRTIGQHPSAARCSHAYRMRMHVVENDTTGGGRSSSAKKDPRTKTDTHRRTHEHRTTSGNGRPTELAEFSWHPCSIASTHSSAASASHNIRTVVTHENRASQTNWQIQENTNTHAVLLCVLLGFTARYIFRLSTQSVLGNRCVSIS